IAGSFMDDLLTYFTPPVMEGQTFITFTPFETRMLGELRLYRNAQGKFSAKARYITLDDKFADDPEAAALVAALSEAERKLPDYTKNITGMSQGNNQARPGGNQAQPPANGSAPQYASSIICAQCHKTEYVQWMNSAHAHAADPFATRMDE